MTQAIQAMPREIEMLERAAAFLAECQDLDEVKALRDKAEAIRLYQRKIDKSGQATIIAGEIKVRAEVRMGELTREMPKAQGKGRGKPKQNRINNDFVDSDDKVVQTKNRTLDDLGISRDEASRVEAMAELPAEEREEMIAKAKKAGRAPTSRELVIKGKKHQREKKKKAAMKKKAEKKKADPSTNGKPPEPTWEIRHGDCLDEFASIADQSIRLIFADPPYNIGINYGIEYDDSRPADEFDWWCQLWLAECSRKLTVDGSLWLLVNHEWARTLCFRAEDVGFHLRQWITWYESFGVNTTRMFNRCSRPLLWLVKDAGDFVFDQDAPQVRRRSDRQDKYGDSRANPEGKLWDDVWGINPPIARVVGTARERMPDFPTQLPLALLRPIVACASEPKDLVLDPFSGSGTTGAACIELGRRFIGIELSEEFAKASRLRLTGMEAEHAVR